MTTLYDITPPITPDLAVFPGDTPPRREVLLDMANGDHITLSTLHATVHLGAHADAPNHYGHPAPSIDACSLDRYLGACQVMHVSPKPGDCVGIDDLAGAVATTRLLLATGTFPDPTQFNRDYSGLEPELVDHLADQGVTLLGIDTPSVDPADSSSLDAHRRFLARDVWILEGLLLRGVPEGHYELIALPLPLVGFDASPVRAVLRALVADGRRA